MKCPYCGFRHLTAQERCARCRKSMDGVPEEQSNIGGETSFEITLSGYEDTGPEASDLSFSLEANEASDTGISDTGTNEVSPAEAASPSSASASDLIPEPENPDPVNKKGMSDDTTVPGKLDEPDPVDRAANESDSGIAVDESSEPSVTEQDPDQEVLSALSDLIKETPPAQEEEELDDITDVLAEEVSGSEALPILQKVDEALNPSQQISADSNPASEEVRDLLDNLNAASVSAEEEEEQHSSPSLQSSVIEESASQSDSIEPVHAQEASINRQKPPAMDSAPVMNEPEPEADQSPASPMAMDGQSLEDIVPAEESGLYGGESEERRLDAFFKTSEERQVTNESEGQDPGEDEISIIEIQPVVETEPGPVSAPRPSLMFEDQAPSPEPAIKSKGFRGIRNRQIKGNNFFKGRELGLRRAGAGLVDFCVWVGFGLMLFKASQFVTGYEAIQGTAGEWALLVVMPLAIMAGILTMVYASLFGSITGQTPGMMLFGLRMAGRNGEKPRLDRVFLKTGIFLVSVLPLGLGLILELRVNSGEGPYDRLLGIRVERI